MLHEDWNLVVFVFGSRYFLNVMNESIMKPELKNTYRKSSSMNWKWGPLICNKYNRVSPTNHIQEDLIQLWQSQRHLKFDKEGDVFWAQMKPQLSQFAWYFPESWKYRGRCSPEIKRFFFSESKLFVSYCLVVTILATLIPEVQSDIFLQ